MDILILAQHFMTRYNQKTGKELAGFTGNAADLLLSYYWSGNVRELENAIAYAVNVELGI